MTAFGPITPVLRMFDEPKAKEFYIEFLGCSIQFEHRYDPNFPLYMGLSLMGCNLHLTEHHGDVCPGAHIRIGCDDIKDYWNLLTSKDYTYAKPGEPVETPWNSLEMTIADPFGNRLTFFQS